MPKENEPKERAPVNSSPMAHVLSLICLEFRKLATKQVKLLFGNLCVVLRDDGGKQSQNIKRKRFESFY